MPLYSPRPHSGSDAAPAGHQDGHSPRCGNRECFVACDPGVRPYALHDVLGRGLAAASSIAKDARPVVGMAYFFSSFGAGAPSLFLFMLPLAGLMPVVSIAPLSLAPLVVPGFSMPVCGA